jgi:Aminoglycoside-2''-adenylyltransferase
MDDRTEGQLRVIRKVIAVTQAAGISVWLLGGWGLDARIGRITRSHGDVEFWVERIHADQSKAVLVAAGATALATQPPEESCEFTWDSVSFSTAYFDRTKDGSFVQLLGRWSDWRFPPGSFGDENGILDGTPVQAMSVVGMLAMKEQYPHLRNGRPWRQKDIDDIEVLRLLVGEESDRGDTRTASVRSASHTIVAEAFPGAWLRVSTASAYLGMRAVQTFRSRCAYRLAVTAQPRPGNWSAH